jgi:hypothetical protein
MYTIDNKKRYQSGNAYHKPGPIFTAIAISLLSFLLFILSAIFVGPFIMKHNVQIIAEIKRSGQKKIRFVN